MNACVCLVVIVVTVMLQLKCNLVYNINLSEMQTIVSQRKRYITVSHFFVRIVVELQTGSALAHTELLH